MRPPPLFVVPEHLTRDIPQRVSEASTTSLTKRGRKRLWTEAESRRRNLKYHEFHRYGDRIDERIAWLELHLELAKEVRDEINER